MFIIYFLVSEQRTKTYIGFSNRLLERLKEHQDKKVITTKNFGNFKAYKIEIVNSVEEARKREKYWKSAIGRKKLKNIFPKL